MEQAFVSHNTSQLLSLVVPCYNEEEVIGETLKRLKLFCSELQNLDTELFLSTMAVVTGRENF